MIFLDSDVLSYYFSGNEKIRTKIVEAIKNKEHIAMTIINVYEALKGFRWRGNTNKEAMFAKFIETVPVFTVNKNTVEMASNIYAKLRKAGKTIGDADILISAIVMENNGAFVTNNRDHFKNVEGLTLMNWLE